MIITYKEKLALLAEMIALAKLDNVLHPVEYDFIWQIAQNWKIREDHFLDLFKNPPQYVVHPSQVKRLEHFYAMALLSHCDREQHPEEFVFLKNVGLKLGLSPDLVSRVLQMIQNSGGQPLSPTQLIDMLNEQMN